ncbi:hypothetical protein MKW94_014461 [Papaver nudicaule]|uniref:Outer envelope protein 61 n=1 Tax=Papaver nudicaule TaxID=74823 RepID=A0AA41SHA6_PAPNU|nr:hypothetical protein [Papaver nudicaule]
MSPAELAKIQQQMMSNPDLIKMASESMKNMRPEDLKSAAEQLKYARTEDMVNIGEKIANASPEEIAAMGTQADARIQYELRGAQMVKKQGNELHSQGKYSDAAEKYLLAKNNLKSMPVSKGRALQLTCSLNLMSCYLKTQQYDDCIKEGSEVLAHDAENVKALYRRGQAYKELGMLQDAVCDLSKALKVSPEDETIANVLRDAQERLSKEGGGSRASSGGLIIEELTEENVNSTSSESNKSSPPKDNSVAKPLESEKDFQSQARPEMVSSAHAESLQGLTDNPETMRSFQNFISQVDPDTLAAMGVSSAEGVPPAMIKTASSMIGKMSPEELQKMMQMASSFQGKMPFPSGATEGVGSNSKRSFPQDISPEMLKSASDMMANMPPDALKKMFEVASSLKGNGSASSAAALSANKSRSDSVLRHTEEIGVPSINRSSDIGESSSFPDFSNFGADPSSSSSFPAPTADMQAQMRNQLKDPAMRQMLSSMMKSMNPEMMANMSEQFGVKLSREDAEKAQQAMSSLSPDALEKMMKWADRIQTGVEGVKKTKNWLLGRRGMILAIFMLVLAFILHRLGFIGS